MIIGRFLQFCPARCHPLASGRVSAGSCTRQQQANGLLDRAILAELGGLGHVRSNDLFPARQIRERT